MNDSNEEPASPDALPETLIDRIDALELPELKSVLSYVERRIEALRTPIAEEIERTASGRVLKVEDHGGYALVRKHPPNPDGSGVDTDTVSLYHVRRDPRPDGSEPLNWAYLGDVHNSEQVRCDSCGGVLDVEAHVCPHCGSENATRSGTGG